MADCQDANGIRHSAQRVVWVGALWNTYLADTLSASFRSSSGRAAGSGFTFGQAHLPEGITTVGEQPPAWSQSGSQAPAGLPASLRVAPVERAYPHGERDLVTFVARQQADILNGDVTDAEASRGQLGARRGPCQRDGPRRPANAEDVPAADATRDLTRRRAGPQAISSTRRPLRCGNASTPKTSSKNRGHPGLASSNGR